MGILDWAMKGVNVESRKNPKKVDEAIFPAPNVSAAANMTSGDVPNLHDFSATDNGQPNASSLLFSPADPAPAPNPYQMYAGALGGATLGNRNILIVTPRTNADISGVVQNLQNGDACIVCFEELSATDAQRRLDFLSGVICAIGGSIKSLNSFTYILTPSGIGVRH